MKRTLLCLGFLLFNLLIIAQQTKTIASNNLIAQINKQYGFTAEATHQKFNAPKYRHYEGAIGNKNATLDININALGNGLTVYLYSDSLENINAFAGGYRNNVFILKNDDWSFQSGNRYFDRLALKLMPDLSLKGYAENDSFKLKVTCLFKLKTKGIIPLHHVSFSENSNYNTFPVKLSGHIFFADTSSAIGRKINKKLVDAYDYIGFDEDAQHNKKPFSAAQRFKTANTYSIFCKRKFEIDYKKVIDKAFLKEAHESGHTDEFVNDLNSTILINDGNILGMQVLCNFADGISYPYYETSEFQYNVPKQKFSFKQKLTDDQIAVIKLKLKNNHFFSADDDWLLLNAEIAFVLDKGIIIKKYGGNHGIHPFYRYIPKRFLPSV